jgi:hypothetical protein
VQGYSYGKDVWYLDPLDPDTDADGLLDSIECFTLTVQSRINTATVMRECDTDGDGTPNPFDLDSDADGVVDAADLAAFAWADRGACTRPASTRMTCSPTIARTGLSVAGGTAGRCWSTAATPQETEHLASRWGA